MGGGVGRSGSADGESGRSVSFKNIFLPAVEGWADGVVWADGEGENWKWIWHGGAARGGGVADLFGEGREWVDAAGVSFGHAVDLQKSGNVGGWVSGLSGVSPS